MLEEVLKAIEKANEQETKIILEAAICKRESQLSGGEIIWFEYTQREVEDGEKVITHMMEIQRQRRTEILEYVSRANAVETEEFLSAAMDRKRRLFPEWDILYLAMPKGDSEERRRTLKSVLEWEDKYGSQTNR